MDKKLIAEDIQRMRFMFGYEPGKVISEQQDINELGGMEDGHPKFGKMNFSKMNDEEIESVLDDILASDDNEMEDDNYSEIEDKDDVIYEIEVEEGFDSLEAKMARGGKDYSSKEFKEIPKGSTFDIKKDDRDDSITSDKYFNNQIDDFLDDVDLSWLDESWDDEE